MFALFLPTEAELDVLSLVSSAVNEATTGLLRASHPANACRIGVMEGWRVYCPALPFGQPETEFSQAISLIEMRESAAMYK